MTHINRWALFSHISEISEISEDLENVGVMVDTAGQCESGFGGTVCGGLKWEAESSRAVAKPFSLARRDNKRRHGQRSAGPRPERQA
ncbi:hypothetical protein [Hydrogenophaga sp. 5NK40-0174]|uniref:hypothetical protein n=1 Tax=Hydrogenophaga sp. 5NK40-0174 TaxID=3127649 RepID=UPI00333F56CE